MNTSRQTLRAQLLERRKHEARDQEIARIAAECFPNIETLETRNRDSLDFHDVAVWAIKAALEAAYEAGRKAAR